MTREEVEELYENPLGWWFALYNYFGRRRGA